MDDGERRWVIKTVLITGCAGFVGRHLASELRAAGIKAVGLDVAETDVSLPTVRGSIEDVEAIDEAVERFRPGAVVHLAGIASVPRAAADPARAFRINAEGTLHLLDILTRRQPKTRVLVVSSAQVYGESGGMRPYTEDDAPRPASIYALTKTAAEVVTRYYADRHAWPAMIARPVNHIGPGQSTDFVVPSFAAQLAEIATGRREPVIRVGNLESTRDFSDVRDIVRGYRLLLERGEPGSTYNLASGGVWSVREILERLCEIAGVRPRVVKDPARYRPADTGPQLDTSRIQRDIGWRAEIPIEKTLRDVYEEAFRRVNLKAPQPESPVQKKGSDSRPRLPDEVRQRRGDQGNQHGP